MECGALESHTSLYLDTFRACDEGFSILDAVSALPHHQAMGSIVVVLLPMFTLLWMTAVSNKSLCDVTERFLLKDLRV
jgi:hypothetical protein